MSSGMRCNRCHRTMLGTTANDGACECGGLIEMTPVPAKKSLYERMVEAGVEIDHYESDLYVPVTVATINIVERYQFRSIVKRFISQRDRTEWFDIPFAYQPFWDEKHIKAKKGSALIQVLVMIAFAGAAVNLVWASGRSEWPIACFIAAACCGAIAFAAFVWDKL